MNVRASGMLLHLTSLPSPYGIGDLGPSAYAFADLLRTLGQLYWQFLPLGPTSPAIGNSPYSSCSAFAGNPLLISPEKMVEAGFLSWADVEGVPKSSHETIDYPVVEQYKNRLLRAAFEKNKHLLPNNTHFIDFTLKHADWLKEYCRFITLKKHYDGAIWSAWPEKYRKRNLQALVEWDTKNADALQFEAFVQFIFFTQWDALRQYCTQKDVRLIGDVPIYVTYDSADVWANPHFFKLDKEMEPIYVAGVPPDYFSKTGQRWGNPVYDWSALQNDGFSWWIQRMAHNFALTDLVRLDHFRGFAGYWEIPAVEKTAMNGKWVDAPGMELFRTLEKHFTVLPLIAEDLGVITADVRELKAHFALPGMKILQFGFGGNLQDNPDAPFNHEKNCVVYSGTHDNAPVCEWWHSEAGNDGRSNFCQFVGYTVEKDDIANAFLRLGMASVANTAIFPIQDILGMDNTSRMNTPSVAKGNWEWRLRPEYMQSEVYRHYATLTRFFGRWT